MLQEARTSSRYGGVTGTGALASGSIASGFGSISTTNAITTTTTVQGATLNATTSLTLNGTSINTAGTLCNATASVNCSDVQYALIAANGTVGAWTATTAFTTARNQHSTVIYNCYLYVIGGYTGSASQNGVQSAPFTANGTVGTWTPTTAFTTARYGQASVVNNGYLYVIGGYDSGGGIYLSDVQYAPIGASGTVGTWLSTTAFTTGRFAHSSVVYNGSLYVVGGNPIGTADVQYARMNTDGTVGTWATTTAFTTARYAHSSQTYNGYLYIIGGYGGADLSDVQYSRINNGGPGTTTAWTATASFTGIRSQHTSVAYNGYLYVIGGFGTVGLADVQYAFINANGTLGAWAPTTSLPATRYQHASVVYRGYLYVTGGSSGVGLNDVIYAPLAANGAVGAWNSTSSFTNVRSQHTTVVGNGYLYIIGETNAGGMNDVQYAAVNPDGTLGAFAPTTSFTTARYGHTSVVYNGYLYVIGGYNGSYLSDVQYSLINADGTIGAFATTTSFRVARFYHASTVYGGYLYIIGGTNGPFNLSDMQLAPFNANGTVGPWTSAGTFATGRYQHAAAFYNGTNYITGGYSGVNLNDVQYAPLTVMPRTHIFSKLLDLGSAGTTLSNIGYSGSLSGDKANITYKLADGTGIFGAIQPASGLTGTCTAGGTTRYVALNVILDDSASAVFPDTSRANVLDLTVNYSSSGGGVLPAQRLFLGKTLQQPAGLSPLDTTKSTGGGAICT